MSKTAAIIILVILFLIVIAYGIAMATMFFTRKGIFGPYKAPDTPKGAFNPLGTVKPLTEQQFKDKNSVIAQTLYQMCTDVEKGKNNLTKDQCDGIQSTILTKCRQGDIGDQAQCNLWANNYKW